MQLNYGHEGFGLLQNNLGNLAENGSISPRPKVSLYGSVYRDSGSLDTDPYMTVNMNKVPFVACLRDERIPKACD